MVAAALLAGAGLPGSWAGTAAAQEPTAPAVTDGDVVWAFRGENPFFDDRVGAALGTLIASQPGGAAAVRLMATGPAGEYEPGHVYDPAETVPLLAAAGYDPAAPFTRIGSCRTWASATDPEMETAVGATVAAFDAALRSLGSDLGPCAATDDPTTAHLLFWRWGETPPPAPSVTDATLLTSPTVEGPGAAGGGVGGGVGGDSPLPPATGGRGPLGSANGTALLLGAGALLLALLATSRRLSARGALTRRG